VGNVSVGKSRKGWIKAAVRHPGALHEQLGTPVGSLIPRGNLEEASRSEDRSLARRARLAERASSRSAKARAEAAVHRAKMGRGGK